jgi:hypothetical protein
MKALTSQDPCVDNGACHVQPSEFVRLRYFFGQRLGVVDLADEQAYVVGKQHFHNARLHGAGILCGLRVDRYLFPQGSKLAAKTTLLRVRRGAALDECGREIVVGWDSCIDVAAWYAQHPDARPANKKATLPLWVALCYRECPSDPSPAPRDPCGCDADGCEFARIREGFELKLLTSAEVALLKAPSAPSLVLPTEPATPYDRILQLFEQAMAGADCPEPQGNHCLILARVEAALDSKTGAVVDLKVDNGISLRHTLLPTSLLQKGLLLALDELKKSSPAISSAPHLALPTFTSNGETAGKLTFPIEGSPLLLDPIASNQLTVKAVQLHADGMSSAASAFDAHYDATSTPATITLTWPASLSAGTYRVLFTADTTQPPVDAAMEPLTPLASAQHITLTDDTTAHVLKLTAAVFA